MARRGRAWSVCGLAAGVALTMLAGCQTPLNLPRGQEAYGVMAPAAADPAYRLAPGDTISVNVFGNPDMSAPALVVDPAGQISLPLIGPVRANGRTTSELEGYVRSRLQPNYLVDPRVSVNVATYATREIIVEGEVNTPGTIDVVGPTTLLTAIARSRGPTRLAKLDQIAVFREADGQKLAARFDLRAIRRGDAPDPTLLPHDKVVVGFNRLQGAYRDALTTIPALGLFVNVF